MSDAHAVADTDIAIAVLRREGADPDRRRRLTLFPRR